MPPTHLNPDSAPFTSPRRHEDAEDSLSQLDGSVFDSSTNQLVASTLTTNVTTPRRRDSVSLKSVIL